MKIVINIETQHLTRHELHCALAHMTYALPDLPDTDIAPGTKMKIYSPRNVVIGVMVVSGDELSPAPSEQPGRDQPAVQPEPAERDA